MHPTFFPFSEFNVSLRKNHLLRHLPYAKKYRYDFSTNDYLGLSQHPLLIQAAIQAADIYGVGAKASRLVSAQEPHLALENAIAKSKKTTSALIFNTGFQANLSVISALLDSKVLGKPPLVFADRLNHASMHVACQLAKVTQRRFRHGDYEHLAALLRKTQSSTQPKFILTESVFGMDGDVACLETLVKLAKEYQAILYVDEAHATGLFGTQGYGLSEDFSGIDITMGTFSKGLGSSGAYIACNRTLKRYLINRCQGFIYSTAPSPTQVAAMQAAWDLLPSLRAKAKALLQTANDLRMTLQKMGFDTGHSTTHIIPVILKEPHITLSAQSFLANKQILVSAIRPPSVGPLQSRLRIALNVNHTQEAISSLVKGLQNWRDQCVLR